jgi:hypothetical protein
MACGVVPEIAALNCSIELKVQFRSRVSIITAYSSSRQLDDLRHVSFRMRIAPKSRGLPCGKWRSQPAFFHNKRQNSERSWTMVEQRFANSKGIRSCLAACPNSSMNFRTQAL